jgi:hypothetical protein
VSIRKNAVGQYRGGTICSGGVRVLIWACLLAGCAGNGASAPPPAQPRPAPAAAPATAPAPTTVTTPTGTSRGPTTEASITRRLESTLKEIPIGVQVPRMAFADVTYPRSREEFAAMGGFTVLLVCSFALDGRELPLQRVVARAGTAGADLPLVARQETRLPPGASVGGLLNRRVDEVYLLPAFATAVDTTITAHFRVSGRALDVLRFPVPGIENRIPEGVDLGAEVQEPGMDALEKLIREELPVIRPGAMQQH